MGRRGFPAYKAPKIAPPNLKLASVLWDQRIAEPFRRQRHAYIMSAPFPFANAQDFGAFVDALFTPEPLQDVTNKLRDIRQQLLVGIDEGNPIDSLNVVTYSRVRLLHIPRTASRRAVLIRCFVASLCPMRNPESHDDPRYNGTWQNPFTGKVETIPMLLSPDSARMSNPEVARALDGLALWATDTIARAGVPTRQFLTDVVHACGSTRMLFQALPGLRQILPQMLGCAEREVEDWGSPYRGKDTFNALWLREKYPLYGADWTNTFRPTLIASALAEKAERSFRPSEPTLTTVEA